MVQHGILCLLFVIGYNTEKASAVNVALSRPANQTETLNYLYLWEASFAVDGCASPDDYESSRCCSCSNAPGENTWTVYLDQAYVIDHVIIHGRSDIDSQLGGFQLYIRQDQFSPELQVYDNTGFPYNNGYFDIPIASNLPVTEVAIKRNPGPLTLCEVEVFAAESTSAVQTASITASLLATSSIVSRFKPTTQSNTLNYVFDWTSDKAVDGDYRSTNPNVDASCATTEQAFNNEWKVDLVEQYIVDKIDLYSRSDGQDQISGFEVYGQVDVGFPEFLIYASSDPLGTSVFNVFVVPATTIRYVIVKRNGLLTLCEVDVFGILAVSPTTSTTLQPPVTSITDTETTTAPPRINVALNKPANQLEDLFYGFWWYASLAVDGCYDRTDPNNVPCCSTSMGDVNNFWSVDLQASVVIDLIEIYGRADQDDQLPGFQLYTQEFVGATEELIYDSTGVPYGDGIYIIPIDPPKLVRFVYIKRNGIISLCEVVVFEATVSQETTTFLPPTSTAPSLAPTAAQPVNIALNQFASQTDTLDFNGYLWEASLAVDGCKPPFPNNDYEGSQCCSGSFAAGGNTWTVFLPLQYVIDRVIVIGRSDISTQLQDFQLYIRQSSISPEILVYDNSGIPYGNGYFDIPITSMLPITQVTVKRPSGPLLLCEIEVFGAIYINPETTSATTDTITASTEGITTTEATTETSTTVTSTAETPVPQTSSAAQTSAAVSQETTTFLPPTSATPSPAPTTAQPVNIALNQFASQTDTLDFNGYLWEASLAVDGCKPPFPNNDYEGSQCCSGSFAAGGNTWTVFLPLQYVIDRVIVIGRSDQSTQLQDFQLYIRQSSISPEILVYDNTGIPYGNGYFDIPITSMLPITQVTVKRPSGPLLLCEVEVFGEEFIDTSSPTADSTTPTTPPAATTTTTPTTVAGTTSEGTITTTTAGETSTIQRSTASSHQTSAISQQTSSTTNLSTSTSSALTTHSETSAASLTSASTLADTTTSTGQETTTALSTQGTTSTHVSSGGGVNVAFGQMATQREPLNYNGFSWTADKAVDGCYDRATPDISRCCSCSQQVDLGDNFWRLTFTETQILMKLNIFGRGDFGTQLDDFMLYINDSSGTPVYDAAGILYTDGIYEIILEPEVHADAIIVKRPVGPEYLYITLCEVEAISACDDGFFGEQCDQKCGFCLEGEPCYKITGTCPNQCAAGYQGTQCFTQCADGNYGNNCQEFCGNCAFGVACDIFTGFCPLGCAPGWKGDLCKTPCGAGTYGADCLNVCGQCVFPTTCNAVTGGCESGCAPGWVPEDALCNTPCGDGFYGAGCVQSCGNCFLGAICDKEDGECPGQCASGWQGLLCNQTCNEGSHGIDCLETCGTCLGGAACDIFTGDCPNGLCDAGFTGTNCKQACGDGFYGAGCVQSCGNCFLGAICDKEDGECPGQCASGWQGLLCNQTCNEGSHGTDCLETCGTCLGGAACDIFTGDCPNGLCDAGFTGTNCKQECTDGFYGAGCTQTCGSCFLNATCDKVNGECPGQCQSGWQGPLCNQGCAEGNHGIDCLETCGSCLGDVACDVISGDCPNGLCDSGFTGTNCKQGCAGGTYGFQCAEICGNCFLGEACNHVNGSCMNGCDAGFKGTLCDTVCDPGTFGANCQLTCGQCEFGVPCNAVTGACPGNCAAGWQGINCNQVCDPGTFGTNCQLTCGQCEFGVPCNAETGACPGNCAADWQGINCDQAVPSTSTVATTTQGESTAQSTTVFPSPETTQESTMNPTQSSTQSPTPGTNQTPSQATTKETSGTSASTPTELPADSTTVSSTETPTAASTQVSTQGSTAGPTQGSTAGPTQGSTAGPTQGSTAGPTQGSTAGPTQGSTAGPTQGSTAGPTQGSTAGPTQGSTAGPTQGSTAGPTQESTAGPTQGSTAGPTQGSTAGPTQGSTAGPTKVSTAGPTQGSTVDPTQSSTADPTQGSTAGPTVVSSQGSSSGPTQGTTDDPWNTAITNTVSNLVIFLSVAFWLLLRRT
ncbi:uncharacterized protein LOC123561470 [Mercenaria mercenaria]|uniref:uncharacterized protein LOC123561470 n=1 Tax=Mercenaria mercenaria TaxID=6596 RepID=UPI00234F4C0A|nr:uncharacterized protein LOC123561470 [Mercenaria mercenaria]